MTRLTLAYQSFGRRRGMERYQDHLEHLVRSVPVDADVHVLRLPDTEISGKGFASAQALDVPAILHSMAAAASSGASAIAVGNGFDPGLWEARELLDVPVVGLFESVAFYALRVGWRLGVLTSGANGVPRIEELATGYGIRSRMTRPATASVTVPMVVSAFDDPLLARPDVGLPVISSVTTLVHHLYGAPARRRRSTRPSPGAPNVRLGPADVIGRRDRYVRTFRLGNEIRAGN